MLRPGHLCKPSRKLHDVVTRCLDADLPRTLADFSRTLGETDKRETIAEKRETPGRGPFLRVELRGFEPLTP